MTKTATQKLFFTIGQGKGTLSLAEACAGAAGEVRLGGEGVGLWRAAAAGAQKAGHDATCSPSQEIVCDARAVPSDALTPELYASFCEAAKGRFLTAHAVVLGSAAPEEVAEALQFFDYVLVPSGAIYNLPKDFRKRVLSYNKE